MKLLTCFTFWLCAHYCAADRVNEILDLPIDAIDADDLLPGGNFTEIKPINITYVGLEESRSLVRAIPEYFASGSNCRTYNLASGESIIIKSNNYPKTYPKNCKCAITIKAADGEKASMTCSGFNLKCKSAKLTIKGDGVNRKLCGTKPQDKTYTSKSDELNLLFASNKNAPKGKGFYCTFTSIESGGEGQCEPCGVSQLSRKGNRVVGGWEATPGHHPWIVGFVTLNTRHVFCGGSLISHRFILTAAHCAPLITTNRQAFLGGHNRSDLTINDLLIVKEVTISSEYNETLIVHDIAIVELQDPVQYTSRIQPVCLPPPGVTFHHQILWSAGWGSQGPTRYDPAPDSLLEVTTIAYTTEQCQSFFPSTDSNIICTGFYGSQRGICAGDSGGPLVHEINGRFYLAGITSFGVNGCAHLYAPDGYARVNVYLPFIKNVTKLTPKTGQCSPQDRNCGVANVNRIVGGDVVDAHKFPWMAAAVYYGTSALICGVTIISEEYVLSAAHCFVHDDRPNFEAGDVQVVFGQHNFTLAIYGRMDVKEIINHHKYGKLSTYDSDIAILKLAQPLLFLGVRYAPVCLGIAKSNYPGVKFIATGWGQLSENGQYPDVLHSVKLPVILKKACVKTYRNIFTITSKMICAGDLKNGKIDTCQGDSGGPLMRYKNGYVEQDGVVSFGYGCARPKKPGVYSKVASFKSWLSNVAKAKYYTVGETYTYYA